VVRVALRADPRRCFGPSSRRQIRTAAPPYHPDNGWVRNVTAQFAIDPTGGKLDERVVAGS